METKTPKYLKEEGFEDDEECFDDEEELEDEDVL
jgi:hypothetical protein